MFGRQAFGLWIALKFFVLLQSKQPCERAEAPALGVNCSQIFCTFAVETTRSGILKRESRCELLSNFLYFCSRNNSFIFNRSFVCGVNCSQIFCTFAVETTSGVLPRYTYLVWIALKFFVLLQSKQRERSSEKSAMRCELLSNFLYFCSRNNFF